MRHRRRGDADSSRSTTTRSASGEITLGDPEGVSRDGERRRDRPLGALARARRELRARAGVTQATRQVHLSAPWHRRARRGARPRDAALRLALARPDRAALRGAARRGSRRAALRRGLERHRRPAPLHAARRRRPGRRGDHVAVLVRRVGELRDLRGRDTGVRGHRPAHVQPRPRRGRGGDHRADEGDRRGRHLRLPVRARPAARALRTARARARRGRLRGARRTLQGRAGRLARPPDGLRVLSEQADHDGRGRRRHDRTTRSSTSCSSRCATRAGSRRARGSSTAGSATTTASTTSRPRSGSGSSRSSTGSSRARAEVAAALHGAARRASTSSRRSPTTTDHVRSWFVYVVKLPEGVDRDAVAAAHGRARRRDGAVPAVDPPAAVHARALRLQRGDAARLGGLQRADARAAVPQRGSRADDQEYVVESAPRDRALQEIIVPWRTASRMIFLGFGKYARADKIYALEPLRGRRARRGQAHARLGRGRPRADHRVAHRAHDPPRDGAGGRGERRDRRRRDRARAQAARRRRAGPRSTSPTSSAARAACSRRRRARTTANSSSERQSRPSPPKTSPPGLESPGVARAASAGSRSTLAPLRELADVPLVLARPGRKDLGGGVVRRAAVPDLPADRLDARRRDAVARRAGAAR